MPSSKPRDYSLTLADGTSEQVFPNATYGSFQERFIANPNEAGDLWVNIFGETAGANLQGSFAIPPKTGWVGATTQVINVAAASALVVTAGER